MIRKNKLILKVPAKNNQNQLTSSQKIRIELRKFCPLILSDKPLNIKIFTKFKSTILLKMYSNLVIKEKGWAFEEPR